MPFPFTLIDHANNVDLARVNPDGSLTILSWPHIIDCAFQPPEQDRFLVGLCQIFHAGRYNFVETGRAQSDAMGAAYQGSAHCNVRTNDGCMIFDHFGRLIIGLNATSHRWSVDWPILELAAREQLDEDNILYYALVRLFMAARDNFITHKD